MCLVGRSALLNQGLQLHHISGLEKHVAAVLQLTVS